MNVARVDSAEVKVAAVGIDYVVQLLIDWASCWGGIIIEAGVYVVAMELAGKNVAGVDSMAIDERACDVEIWTLLRVSGSLHSHVHPLIGVEVDAVVVVECTLVTGWSFHSAQIGCSAT